jgi:hypothetical protein
MSTGRSPGGGLVGRTTLPVNQDLAKPGRGFLLGMHLFRNVSRLELGEASQLLVVVHGQVQVGRGDAYVCVSDGVANFGQDAAAGQGVADERVPAVVDGKSG